LIGFLAVICNGIYEINTAIKRIMTEMKMIINTKIAVIIDEKSSASETSLATTHVDVILASFESANAILHVMENEEGFENDTFYSTKMKKHHVSKILFFYLFF
jgi:hypothetical protein